MAKLVVDRKILIVGLGLIGGSYAEGLKRYGFELGAISRSRSSIDYAVQKGIIDHGRCEVSADYVSQFDIVIFALYPQVFRDWIRDHQHCFKSGAVISDVTGVKGTIVDEIQSMLRTDVEFVSAHPMAGREVYGVQNSDASIFAGANFIITPTAKNTEEAIELIASMAKLLGFKKISCISPEEHDEMIGFLSQLTHCIAVALMTCKEDASSLARFSGDSFRDLTRIARINEDMWAELFLENKEQLLRQMTLFMDKFNELRKALQDSDEDTLKEMMRLSTERRAHFDK